MVTDAHGTDLWHGFLHWLGDNPLGTFLRAYVAAVVALAVADWSTAASVSFANWKSWVLSALAAAIPVILRWINPADDAYGNGKK